MRPHMLLFLTSFSSEIVHSFRRPIWKFCPKLGLQPMGQKYLWFVIILLFYATSHGHNLTDIKAQPNDNQTEQFKFY